MVTTMATHDSTVTHKTCGNASALHVSAGGLNLVGIGNLRVMISNDGSFWFAQGLEIDYSAEGRSLEDVKKEFADGLALTISEHLHVFGTLDNFLKTAPEEIWREFLHGATHQRFSQVSVHVVPDTVKLDFYEPKCCAFCVRAGSRFLNYPIIGTA